MNMDVSTDSGYCSDETGDPTTEDNCPVVDVDHSGQPVELSRAIRDGAILVDGYTSAEPFYTTDLPGQGMSAIKVNWKEEWLKRPVFRRSVRTVSGWVKSKTEPMTYPTYAFLTSHCFRRGTANAVNGAASDSVRDQVLRHDPSTGVFSAAYRDQLVRFNVQDAFLESNISDDGLTRAFTHMSIRCNPGAPDPVSEEFMQQFYAQDPGIVDLERQTSDLKDKIKWEHRQQNPAVLENDEANVEPVYVYQLQERARLQQVLCDLSKDLSPQEIRARKILAVNLMTALSSRQEHQTHKPRLTRASLPALKQQTPSPLPQLPEFAVVCEKTQCIFCLGNELLSYEQRTFTFSRVSHMMDHVERVHLKHQSVTERVICHHPVCMSSGLVLKNVNHFKHHVQVEHGIKLREPRYV
ncbi:hypothetical protein CJF30_00009884 [Rutstroemia sp. NJR-2017a BBW]|nr:hypothetical protein CJF30_00009884 [Rutstroemia sp. NJR-2017a BBW]